MSANSAQLSLTFEVPDDPILVSLELSGLTVQASAVAADDPDAVPGSATSVLSGHLIAIGVIADLNERTTGEHIEQVVSFHVHQLASLTRLPDQVRIVPGALLAPLWQLASRPAGSSPARVAVEDSGAILLRLASSEAPEQVLVLDRAAVPALLHAQVPFVADEQAWRVLRAGSNLPVTAGRARLNGSGVVEIHALLPQLVEAASLRGLHRLAEDRYAMPALYAEDLMGAPGFVWDGPPVPELRTAHVVQGLTPLSEHHRADLPPLMGALAAFGPQALIWPSGLGRRIMALAALESVEAYPALIVCQPAQVWAWRRHLALFGRTSSVRHDRADVRIVTWRDIPHHAVGMSSPAALIADSFTSELVRSPQAFEALRTLTANLDCLRIGVASRMPTDVRARLQSMALLRPGEFRFDVLPDLRYPQPAIERAEQHVRAYLWTREADPKFAESPGHFPRTKVVWVPTPAALAEAVNLAAFTPNASAAVRLTRAAEVLAAGTAHLLSPRIGAATRLMHDHAQARRSVAVVMRSPRAADLLERIAFSCSPARVDARVLGGPDGGIEGELDVSRIHPDTRAQVSQQLHTAWMMGRPVLVLVDALVPDLSAFDVVIVFERPWDAQALEDALAQATGSHPQLVLALHASGTLDDRWVTTSIGSAEAAGVRIGPALPSEAEILTLLAPR
jgi:hypothetical protein